MHSYARRIEVLRRPGPLDHKAYAEAAESPLPDAFSADVSLLLNDKPRPSAAPFTGSREPSFSIVDDKERSLLTIKAGFFDSTAGTVRNVIEAVERLWMGAESLAGWVRAAPSSDTEMARRFTTCLFTIREAAADAIGDLRNHVEDLEVIGDGKDPWSASEEREEKLLRGERAWTYKV